MALCSFTTVVGYASLLFSANKGIRSFGLAALIGEMTCIGAAIALAPALLDFRLRKQAGGARRVHPKNPPPRASRTLARGGRPPRCRTIVAPAGPFVSSSPAGLRQARAVLGSPPGTPAAESRSVKTLRELLTAGIGGAFGTGLDLGLLVVLVGHHVPIPLATFIATLAGAATNFTLNKYVAFRDRSPISLGQVARFDLVAVVAALLMAAAMKIATANLGRALGGRQARLCGGGVRDLDLPAQRRLVFPRRAEVA